MARDAIDFPEFSLIPIYGVLVLGIIFQIVRIRRRVQKLLVKRFTTQQLFHCLLLLCATGRLSFFSLAACDGDFFDKWFRNDESGFPLNQLFPDLLSIGFYTTYLLLIFFWAEVLYTAQCLNEGEEIQSDLKQRMQRRFWLIVITLVLFVCGTNLITNFQFNQNNSQLYRYVILISFFPFLGLVTAISFAIYGRSLYRQLTKMNITSVSIDRELRKVGVISVLCTSLFSIRGIVVAIFNSFFFHLTFSENAMVPISIGFYSLFEVLPSILTMYALRRLPDKAYGGSTEDQQGTPHSIPPDKAMWQPPYYGSGGGSYGVYYYGGIPPPVNANEGFSYQRNF